MIYRLMAIAKRLVVGFFRVLCCILRCGRRKKVQVDDTLPTDIVIGDAVAMNLGDYAQGSSTLNGFEVTTTPYYDQQQGPRHPFQSQVSIDPAEQQHTQQYDENADSRMQSWDQWGYDDAPVLQSPNSPQQHDTQTESPKEEEVDFFADMEPSVKVKKIFVKKKQRNTNNSEVSSRLTINKDLDFRTASELDAWKEEDMGEGWIDEDVDIDEIDADKVAREARELRKQERMQRSEEQKKIKLARKPNQHKDHRLGTKVS